MVLLGMTFSLGCDEDEPEASPEPEAVETQAEAEPEPEEPAEPEGPTWDGPPLACARAVVVAWQGAQFAGEDITRSKEEAQAHAAELREKVEGGDSIADVARTESDAPSSSQRGGLLGTYTQEDWPEMHGALRDPIFAADVGELTPVVEAPYGYLFAERCPVELIHTRHILVRYAGAKNAPEDIERDEAAARALAEELRRSVADGADFEEAARDKSEDGSAERGGDVGVVGRGVLAPAYEEAAFALAPGEISAVVETDFGFHVIQRVE